MRPTARICVWPIRLALLIGVASLNAVTPPPKVGDALALPVAVESIPQATSPTESFLRQGTGKLEVGSLYFAEMLTDKTSTVETPRKDRGMAMGFVDAGYQTPSLEGWQAGIGAIGLSPYYERKDGDFDRYCKQDHTLRELYVKWQDQDLGTEAQVGRFVLTQTGLDGDGHQGLEVRQRITPQWHVRGAVLNRWVNNARINPNFLGMNEWESPRTANASADDYVYLGSSDIQLPENKKVSPFVIHQENVMMLYGSSADFPVSIGEHETVGVEGTYALYANETPSYLKPDYEDVRAWLVHGYWTKDALTLGIGWHASSDDDGNQAAGAFTWIDPMTVDEIVPYSTQNNAQLYYTDAKLKLKSSKYTLRYGYAMDETIDVHSHEVDAIATYFLTPRIRVSGMASVNVYSGAYIPDYTRIGSLIGYSF